MIESTFYLAAAALAVVYVARETSPRTAVALSVPLIALVAVLATAQRPTDELVAVINALTGLLRGPGQ